jgi:hypothetical protein
MIIVHGRRTDISIVNISNCVFRIVYLFITRLERCNPYRNTHVSFENSELSIKDYAIYLIYTTLVSNFTNHVVLKVCFKYRKSIMTRHNALLLCGSIRDSHAWDLRIESWWSNVFFHALAMLFFTWYKELLYQNFVFSENLSPFNTVWPYCKWR